jgi:DNA-binding response OmpR family regulator
MIQKILPKILIVDDDEDIRDAVDDILRGEGFRTSLAANGAEALELLRADTSYDLVILDLMMPVMSGEEFCAEWARLPKTCKTLLLIMSAGEHPESHIRSLGAHCYLRKPLEMKMLIREVRRCLKLQS